MRAEVLVLRSTARFPVRQSLHTYVTPEPLRGAIAPGQLVAVPFGARIVPGIVWALDASDEATTTLPDSDSPALRRIARILFSEPLLSAHQRALADWLASQYAAPLSATARLMLPPGLLSSMRVVLRMAPCAETPDSRDSPAPALSADSAAILALLRERDWLGRGFVEEALGHTRAQTVIDELLAARCILLELEISGSPLHGRRERTVRLIAAPEQLDEWRTQTRAELDTLPHVPLKRPSWQKATPDERRAERLLRQLAVVDALARSSGDSDADSVRNGWRLEDLRRLTRASASALNELATGGLLALAEVEVRHDPLAGRPPARSEPLPLTPAQAAALATIRNALPTSDAADATPHEPAVFLLHGITGSGKTEVYLQALAATLARGLRGIVLVPEIALTPQAMARFAGRFPGRVALLHSELTPAERLSEWRRIRSGAVDVVVGSRSALFSPVDRLGIIIVDEEHEAAYKQERMPSYHARDAAMRLGALTGAAVVLGSATPSVETYWLASQSTYTLIELRERAPAGAGAALAALPSVALVDLRAELRNGNTSILSDALRTALHETIDRGEQAILFLNRRGTASSVVCRECGYVARCPHCDVSMTYHAPERALICHYCGKREPSPTTCPNCWSASIRYFGLGTERVETAVKRQFPGARVLRWDRDTARTRQAHEELLRAFAERRADVLVGTQMIAKGLDLPGVTLVGVVSADVALFLPDFRASERAFQLLTQVAGRAGRGDLPGQVLVQTFNPEHFTLQAAARHDYAQFYAAEIAARARYSYPPFRRFVKYTFEHTDRYTAQVEAMDLANRMDELIRTLGIADTDLVGPAPAFLERLRRRYRWQLILRSPDPRPLLRALHQEELPFGWSVDVDPASTL